MDGKVALSAGVPLVVDLDGTLLKVDTLHESLALILSHSPRQALNALIALRHGRANFKAAVADNLIPDPVTTPVDEAVVAVVKQAHSEGRRVYLATAADRRIADAFAGARGPCPFDGVFATEKGINLKGEAKAARLTAEFGFRGFDYVGDAADDIPVWRAARTPLITRGSPRLIAALFRVRPDAVVLSHRAWHVSSYVRALRVHQWIKNALISLPAIAGHTFNLALVLTLLIAFASFSLGASSIYLVNDMLDLEHDRSHNEKRHRPFAAGIMPLKHGALILSVVAATSLGLALLLPWKFLGVLLGYFALSFGYAFYLKRKLMIDVVALGSLYGARVLAGSVATGIATSQWLMAFCFFIFLSLALIKRATELMALLETNMYKISGRNYRRADLPMINALAAAAGFGAVLVLALYINSPDVRLLYRRPDALWGICIVLVYWLGRVCLLTGRREMRQDPVLFAATDRITWNAVAVVATSFLVAL